MATKTATAKKATKAPAFSISVELTYDKETPRTHVYKSEEGAIRALYIQKEDMPDDAPKTITVTVS